MSIQERSRLIDANQKHLDIDWELPAVRGTDLGIYIDAGERLMTTVRSGRSPIQQVVVTTSGELR
ncbi:hypothetical protein PHABIO_79 [Pseudomonas phage Phabio]|uniref:Uncharacterized protein n=1 Tax=Pseudomonas phage Phabio TaxID=2006668 RepID=A0A1Y0STR3_9CAUD|nr:hypothetical protein MZD05_gp079 [Pseudomonas phage Phabio]ARV76710.1 hypothetical protein PHABIO_79 [Pseudomonas phage Phabio]